ncbi:MAG: endonuclease NucS domain-containing protein [Caldilinea sp.]|uniref:endonuclease NucS domain-containing protein n=1 Tax=Caldilinea sp. TaxID=2293560 RepID=UPI002C467244|nr:DUF1016 family protein [Anaerolineales bacterium]HQY94826.1 endonuclease NucS [Caldilinea sp.]HRA65702.1 endonuclease NucS [Caldilinea sp.]
MTEPSTFDAAVERLRTVLASVQTEAFAGAAFEPSLMAPAAVLARFQPIFAPTALPEMQEAGLRDFLIFDNNKHWSGLQRLGPRLCADMPTLRSGLAVLLNESKPIADRYDYAIGHINGMGRAVATAILLVAHPDRYGVWNTTSEAGLKALELWPRFERGEREGSRYATINVLLLELCAALQVDLWTLDALWYYLLLDIDSVKPPLPPPVIDESDGGEVIGVQAFGLERHLHEFLRDNWAHTELGKTWRLYREPGNENAGYEYPCNVGRIDLLAHHCTEPKWLVVELKRSQTSDQTAGQVLRYIGWVMHHLAEPHEEVHGLIVAHSVDPSLTYAVSAIPNVDLMLYQVHFSLQAAPRPERT